MIAPPPVDAIAQTIQTSVAPVFLLAGLGAILNLLAGRLARVVDRVRLLETRHAESTGDEHARHVWELRQLDRRMRIINGSMFLCVASAVAICSVVGLLFVAELAQLDIGTWVALAFIAAMVFVVSGLLLFLLEVRLSLRVTHVRVELLEQDDRRRRGLFGRGRG